MSQRVEQAAADALRAFLLLRLPARVAAVNATRAAVLTAPWAGPYVIPIGAVLGVGAVPLYISLNPDLYVERTAADLADDINAWVPGIASADADGRLVLTDLSTPEPGAPSVMAIGVDNGGEVDGAPTGSNAALGFNPGGERVVRSALAAPSLRGVMDGWPVTADFQGGGVINIVIGDRSSDDIGEKRRNEKLVGLDVTILWADPASARHRNREGIASAVRCVREVINTDQTLGRAAFGDIVYCDDGPCQISGLPFNFGSEKGAPLLFDGASMRIDVKVFERPG